MILASTDVRHFCGSGIWLVEAVKCNPDNGERAGSTANSTAVEGHCRKVGSEGQRA